MRHELRYAGQSFELAVDEELPPTHGAPGPGLGPEQLRAAFAREHERRYGYSDPAGELELVTMRISRVGPRAAAQRPAPRRARPAAPSGGRSCSRESRGAARRCSGASRAPGSAIAGPALWALPEATLLVPPGWRGEVDRYGSVLLERDGGAAEAGRR